jgi:hypothetical protein
MTKIVIDNLDASGNRCGMGDELTAIVILSV